MLFTPGFRPRMKDEGMIRHHINLTEADDQILDSHIQDPPQAVISKPPALWRMLQPLFRKNGNIEEENMKHLIVHATKKGKSTEEREPGEETGGGGENKMNF